MPVKTSPSEQYHDTLPFSFAAAEFTKAFLLHSQVMMPVHYTSRHLTFNPNASDMQVSKRPEWQDHQEKASGEIDIQPAQQERQNDLQSPNQLLTLRDRSRKSSPCTPTICPSSYFPLQCALQRRQQRRQSPTVISSLNLLIVNAKTTRRKKLQAAPARKMEGRYQVRESFLCRAQLLPEEAPRWLATDCCFGGSTAGIGDGCGGGWRGRVSRLKGCGR